MAHQQYTGATGSQFGDTTLTKVFVGGLAWETQRETMRRYFDQFGEILEAVVITDKNTGRSKGYGFVTFRDPEAARRACIDPSPVIDGRRANCNIASLGRPRPSPPHGRMRPGSPYPGVPQTGQAYAGGQNLPPSLPYAYQPGVTYPPYGYTTYAPEYAYHQAGPAFPTPQGYGVQAPHIMQFAGPGGTTMTTMPQQYGAAMPVVQGPGPSAVAAPVPSHPQFMVPAQSQQKLTQGDSGSEHPSG